MKSSSSDPLVRRPDWEQALTDWQDAAAAAPFGWGKHDCAIAAADAIRAMTGTDVAADFRGYTTKRAALKRLKQVGGVPGLVDRVTKRHRMPEVPISHAQRGDVVELLTPDGPALGIVSLDGLRVLSADEPGGLVEIPIAQVPAGSRAFQV